MVWLIPPLLCAVAGAILGRFAVRSGRGWLAVTGLAAAVIVIAVAGLIFLGPSDSRSTRTLVIGVLDLTVVAALPFATAWIASRNAHSISDWFVPTLVAIVTSVFLLFLWFGLALACAIAGDCI